MSRASWRPSSKAIRKPLTKLLPLVYEELRKLVAHRMANEKACQTLQPTALVREAWLRLVLHEVKGRKSEQG